MTKVIAGAFKSRNLRVPHSVTRPTTSRVREAMFSTLQHMLGDFSEMQVLDLYAGSGALGIESASRGATHVDFVESDARACETIKENLTNCGCDVGKVHSTQVLTYLDKTQVSHKYDVVFLDPPYSLTDEALGQVLEALAAGNWLAQDAVVVVERGRRSAFAWPTGYVETSMKAYGDTAIWYGQYVDA